MDSQEKDVQPYPNDSSDAGIMNYLEGELHELLHSDVLMFDFFQEAASDGLWYWDLIDQENEWMSPKFWKTLGIDPATKKHLSSEWQDLIYKEDLEIAKRNLTLHLSDPDFPYDQIVRYHHQDGSTVWIRCRGIAIYNNNGEAIRLLGSHTDLTPVIEKQQALISSQNQVEQLQRYVGELEHELNIAKSHLGFVEQRLNDLKPEDDFGYTTSSTFVETMNTLARNASAIGVQLVALRIDISSRNAVEQVAEFSTKINHVIKDLAPHLCLTRVNEHVLAAIGLNSTGDEVPLLIENINKKLHELKWLTVKPRLDVTYKVLEPDGIGCKNFEQCCELIL